MPNIVLRAKEFLTQINYLLYRKGLGKGKGEARKKIKGLRFFTFAFSSAFACTLVRWVITNNTTRQNFTTTKRKKVKNARKQ